MTGQTSGEMTREQRVNAIARTAHEANRAWCISHGDDSQLPWDAAPEWQRESCRNGVEAAARGLTPSELHENWMAEKIEAGWAHGPVKDPEHKLHPCIASYEDLPAHQRVKDSLFHGVCNALIPVLLVGRFA